MKKALLFFVLLSCMQLRSNAVTDTTQLLANLDGIKAMMERDVDSARSMIFENIALCEEAGFNKGLARTYLQLIQYHYLRGTADSAIAIFPELEKAAKAAKDPNLTINVLLKIALTYSDIGDFRHAVEKAIQAQKLADGSTNYRLVAKVYHDLGLLYSNKSIYKGAFMYWRKGLRYAFMSKDTFSIANMYARIGGAFNETDSPDSGLYYNNLSLKYFEHIKMKRGIGVAYNNIAGSYELKKDYPKAIEYFKKAMPIRQELGDEYAITIIAYNMGVCYLHMKQYALAEQNLRFSLERTKKELDFPQQLETLKQLCVLSSENGDLRSYHDFAREYMTLKDSIVSADNVKTITDLQAKYESEKRERDILNLQKENEKQEAISASERKNKFIILVSSIIILVLMGIFGSIIFKRYKVTKKQKHIIELQKELVEEKQKEILDSIAYAKRLQEAILPPAQFIKEHFPASFVLYRPKDIVAGDFYWMEVVGAEGGERSEKNDTHTHHAPHSLLLLAAADCTGHGVPGAMVSVVCSNALNRTVKEFGITEPGKILDKVRELVIETFEKSESEVRDGMDISLFCFDPEKMELKWAGANNPLWLIRNGQLIDHKPDKQPIGKMDEVEPFQTQVIRVEKNDSIYLFTDGYADQFGGPKGKKFKYKQMQEVLLENVALSPEQQLQLLEKRLREWQGDLEQIDDILVIGIRI